MEAWIRCNKCYRSWKNSRRDFVLTQCQHIFCTECSLLVKEQCPECKTTDVVTMPLATPLPEPIMRYFGSLSKMIEQALLVEEFQTTQALIVLRRYSEIEQRYGPLKMAVLDLKKRLKTMTEDYNNLKLDLTNRLRKREMLQTQVANAQDRSARITPTKMAYAQTYNRTEKRSHEYTATSVSNRNDQSRQLRFRPDGIANDPSPQGFPNNSQSFSRHGNQLTGRLEYPSVMSSQRSYQQSVNHSRMECETEVGRFNSNYQTFGPHCYQPRAILSEDVTSYNHTPTRHEIHSQIPRSRESSTYIKSMELGPFNRYKHL